MKAVQRLINAKPKPAGSPAGEGVVREGEVQGSVCWVGQHLVNACALSGSAGSRAGERVVREGAQFVMRCAGWTRANGFVLVAWCLIDSCLEQVGRRLFTAACKAEAASRRLGGMDGMQPRRGRSATHLI